MRILKTNTNYEKETSCGHHRSIGNLWAKSSNPKVSTDYPFNYTTPETQLCLKNSSKKHSKRNPPSKRGGVRRQSAAASNPLCAQFLNFFHSLSLVVFDFGTSNQIKHHRHHN